MTEERKVIDEVNYSYALPQQQGPAAISKGGDPLYMKIKASKTQLSELLEETSILQDWIQKETCNKVALSFLDNENLKEIYYVIKDGFNDYGPMILMGYKSPQGVEIPRLKLLDKNGEVLSVLTGPAALDEINKRVLEYQNLTSSYEVIDTTEEIINQEIVEYDGHISETTEAIPDYNGPT